MSGNTIEIGGPYFEDFEVGQIMPDAPAVTITAGHAAVHQALFGDRLRLPLDHPLSQRITGHDQPLANPSLVCNIAIGQTTYASQRVKANLFYRAWSSSARSISGIQSTPPPEWPRSSKTWPSRASLPPAWSCWRCAWPTSGTRRSSSSGAAR